MKKEVVPEAVTAGGQPFTLTFPGEEIGTKMFSQRHIQ